MCFAEDALKSRPFPLPIRSPAFIGSRGAVRSRYGVTGLSKALFAASGAVWERSAVGWVGAGRQRRPEAGWGRAGKGAPASRWQGLAGPRPASITTACALLGAELGAWSSRETVHRREGSAWRSGLGGRAGVRGAFPGVPGS